MPSLTSLEALGAASLSSFWLPLLIWTAGAAAVLAGLRWAGLRAHPLTHVRLLGATLAALPAGLLVAVLAPSASVEPVVSLTLGGVWVIGGEMDAAPAAPALSWPLVGWGIGAALVALGAAVGLIRLAGAGLRLARLSSQLVPAPPDVQRQADRLRVAYRIRRRVRVCIWEAPAGAAAPFVFGLFRPTIVLPTGLDRDAESCRLVLLHEFAHVRHGDLFGQVWTALVRSAGCLHPLVHLIGRALDAARERACDGAVLAAPRVSPRRYGALLLSIARSPAPRLTYAMASPSPLHQRLLAMNAPTSHRPLAPALALLLGLGLAVAPAVAQVAPPPAPVSDAPPAPPAPPEAPAPPPAPEAYPELIGGIQGVSEKIQYPALARQAGIEGRVFVRFDVGLDGGVSNAEVVRSDLNASPDGDDGGLSAEALRVVRTLRFRPAEGQKGLVTFTLPITFTLPKDAEDQGALGASSSLRYAGVDPDRLVPGSRAAFLGTMQHTGERFAEEGRAPATLVVRFSHAGRKAHSPVLISGDDDLMLLARFLVGTLEFEEAADARLGTLRLTFIG